MEVFIISLLLNTILGMFALLYRNKKVYEFRARLNDFCYKKGMQYIKDHQQPSDHYDWFDTLPDYNKMVMKFWKPLDSFVIGKYRDDFLEWNKNG